MYDDCKCLSQSKRRRKQQLDISMEESRNRSLRRRRRLPLAPAKDVGTSTDRDQVKGDASRQTNRALATTVAGAAAVLFFKSIVPAAAASNIATTTEKNAAAGSLWELVSEDPSYSNLTACLNMADPEIVAALSSSGERPVTLFAPKDEAFSQQDWSKALLSGESDGLLVGNTIFDNRYEVEVYLNRASWPCRFNPEPVVLGDDVGTFNTVEEKSTAFLNSAKRSKIQMSPGLEFGRGTQCAWSAVRSQDTALLTIDEVGSERNPQSVMSRNQVENLGRSFD